MTQLTRVTRVTWCQTPGPGVSRHVLTQHDAMKPERSIDNGSKSTSKQARKIVLSIQPVAPNTQVIVAKFTLRELEPRARCMSLS